MRSHRLVPVRTLGQRRRVRLGIVAIRNGDGLSLPIGGLPSVARPASRLLADLSGPERFSPASGMAKQLGKSDAKTPEQIGLAAR